MYEDVIMVCGLFSLAHTCLPSMLQCLCVCVRVRKLFEAESTLTMKKKLIVEMSRPHKAILCIRGYCKA